MTWLTGSLYPCNCIQFVAFDWAIITTELFLLFTFWSPWGFGRCGRRNWGMWFCVRRRHPFSNHRHIVWPQNKWKLRSILVLVCQKQNEESWYWLNHTRLPGWARPNAYSGCPTWNLWKLSAMWEFQWGGSGREKTRFNPLSSNCYFI